MAATKKKATTVKKSAAKKSTAKKAPVRTAKQQMPSEVPIRTQVIIVTFCVVLLAGLGAVVYLLDNPY